MNKLATHKGVVSGVLFSAMEMIIQAYEDLAPIEIGTDAPEYEKFRTTIAVLMYLEHMMTDTRRMFEQDLANM